MPTPTVAGRLSEAWAFLCGESQPFVQVAPPSLPRAAHGAMAAMLPLHGENALVAACRVELSDEQVSKVASHLFGVEAAALSDADRRDAALEACNVLGSCLAGTLVPAQRIHIGCPEPEGALLEGLATRIQFRPQAGSQPRLDLLSPAGGVAMKDQQP